jgi:hypothetical protein
MKNFLFFTQTLHLTKLQKHENTGIIKKQDWFGI